MLIIFGVIFAVAGVFTLASALIGEDKNHPPQAVFVARVILVIMTAIFWYASYNLMF